MEHDHTIDISGLCCAQPIIRITQELKQMATGNVLLVHILEQREHPFWSNVNSNSD
jgi:TusA-related sulfurtransferase